MGSLHSTVRACSSGGGNSVTVLRKSRNQECNTLINLDIQADRIWTIEGNWTKSVSRKVLCPQVSGHRALPCPPSTHTHHPVSYAAKAFTQQVITFKQWNALFSILTKAKTTLFSSSLSNIMWVLFASWSLLKWQSLKYIFNMIF